MPVGPAEGGSALNLFDLDRMRREQAVRTLPAAPATAGQMQPAQSAPVPSAPVQGTPLQVAPADQQQQQQQPLTTTPRVQP
jgi:general secretion pathway protein D